MVDEVTFGRGGPDGHEVLSVAVQSPHARLPSDAAIVDPRPPRQPRQPRDTGDGAEAAAVGEDLDGLRIHALRLVDGPAVPADARAADPADEPDEFLGVAVVADHRPARAPDGGHRGRRQRRQHDAPVGRRAGLRELEMLQPHVGGGLDERERVALVDEAKVAALEVGSATLEPEDEEAVGRARRLARHHRGPGADGRDAQHADPPRQLELGRARQRAVLGLADDGRSRREEGVHELDAGADERGGGEQDSARASHAAAGRGQQRGGEGEQRRP